MFYIRTADKLQRTARWLEGLPGGISYLREVILDDKLGINASLEAQMQELVDSFFDEWAEALKSPSIAAKFRQFANDDSALAGVEAEVDRGQSRPAFWAKEPAAEDFKGLRDRWTQTSWQPVLEASYFEGADEAPNGVSATIRRGDTQLALFRVRGKYYCTQQMCPHKRAFVLSDGLIGQDTPASCSTPSSADASATTDAPGTQPSPTTSAPWVSCPHHKRNFDLSGGQCRNDEALSIATFAAEERADGMVYVRLPPVAELDAALGTARWRVKAGEAGPGGFAELDKKTGFKGQRARKPGVRPHTELAMRKPVQLLAVGGGGGGGCGMAPEW
jgi:nitrite reductase (NAD(P)H)